MYIKQFENGLLDSNTYVVWGDSKIALIVDSGVKTAEIAEFVKKNGLTVKHIVLTHGHYDHVNYIGEYLSTFEGAIPYCHRDELKILLDPNANVSRLFTRESKSYDYDYTFLSEGDTLAIDDSISFTVLNLPGHTPGSIALYCEKEGVLFTGDVVSAGGWGRTDFLYGNHQDMDKSLSRIYSLDKNTTIYPGHYEITQLYKIFKY